MMMKSKQRTRLLGCSLLAVAALAACDDDGVGIDEDANLRILLTDAPADYIASARVDIGAVELIGGDGGPVLLSDDGTDGFVDLLDLQGGATTLLADMTIPAGDYAQIRLIVESAEVTLADGFTFNDGSTEQTLFVPSGAQTGIKLNLSEANGEEENEEGRVRIASGETVLVLDFDVHQSFVVQGNPSTPAGINGVLFTPTIRVVAQDVAASVSGTVTPGTEGLSVEGLTVRAEPVDEGSLEDFQSATGTATTDAEGNYTIHFLVPGSYTVSVETGDGLAAEPESTNVELGNGEDETGVDFVVSESTP